LWAGAQNVTVINHFDKDTTGTLQPEDFVLRSSEKHTIVINYYEPANPDQVTRLQQLIGGALNFYIDEATAVEDNRVNLRKSKKKMLVEMNQIVEDAVKYYAYKEEVKFNGFSNEVYTRIEWLDGMDLSNAANLVESPQPMSLEKARHFYLQSKLNDLKLLANQEVGNYSRQNFLVYSGSEVEEVAADQEALLEEIRTFSTNDPLQPLEVDFSRSTMDFLASEDQFILPGMKPKPAVQYTASGQEEDFADRVFAMLEANNQKLDKLQSEMNDIRQGQAEANRRQQDATNSALQLQINDLREMIVQLVSGDVPIEISDPIASGGVSTGGGFNRPATTNLPTNIDVRFNLGSTSLNVNNKLMLNEIIDILARNPFMKIMVTGYADKVGNKEANLRLSQLRAKQVSQYILASGIARQRVLVNYFGDTRSEAVNPDDRKVVIEFLPN
jgi:outer membrane protein OmpA-like peptidoglycan-associated protein